MSATDTMKWMSRSARNKAQTVSHSMKDRALEKRLERAADEADRLRFENELLRDEVSETRSEHHRILDLLESRLSEPETKTEKKTHKGRWLVFLTALGGGAYALVRMRSSNGHGLDEWEGHNRGQTTTPVTQTGTSTMV